MLPLEYWNERHYYISERKHAYWQLLAIGFITFAVVFNLGVIASTRDSSYLYFVIFALGSLSIQGILEGFAFEIFWPEVPALNDIYTYMLPIGMYTLSEFSRRFLALEGSSNQLARLMSRLAIVSVAIVLFLPQYLANQICLYLFALVIVSLLLLSLFQVSKHHREARLYSIAMLALFAGVTTTIARVNGWIGINEYSLSAPLISTSIQSFIVCIAIAQRIYTEKSLRIMAQSKAQAQLELRQSAEQKLLHHATHNPVTNLPNRASLQQSVEYLIGADTTASIALWCLRLSNYKTLTLTLGDQQARQLLQNYIDNLEAFLKQRLPTLHATLTPPDQPLLYSTADDQLIFLTTARQEQQLQVELLDLIQRQTMSRAMSIHFGALIGYACWPYQCKTANSLIKSAEMAVLQANRMHRVVRYSPMSEEHEKQRLTRAMELQPALRAGQIQLYLQPQVELASHKVVGFEALIRWFHPSFGLITPDLFIPDAERTGLINLVTPWVISQALDAVIQLRRYSGLPLAISVNISALDLVPPDFGEQVVRLLEQRQLPPSALTLELTETSALHDLGLAKQKLTWLHRHGIKIALDDFGTGFSSLSLLQDLPISELKLDRSLLRNVHDSIERQRVLEMALEVGLHLNITTVAEGIEEERTSELLYHLKCERGQGYLFAKPMPLNDALRWLEQHKSGK